MAKQDQTDAAEPQSPLQLGAPHADITPLDRARLRVDCLKIAVECRTAQKPVASLIKEAREFEQYVFDPVGMLPAGEEKDGK